MSWDARNHPSYDHEVEAKTREWFRPYVMRNVIRVLAPVSEGIEPNWPLQLALPSTKSKSSGQTIVRENDQLYLYDTTGSRVPITEATARIMMEDSTAVMKDYGEDVATDPGGGPRLFGLSDVQFPRIVPLRIQVRCYICGRICANELQRGPAVADCVRVCGDCAGKHLGYEIGEDGHLTKKPAESPTS